MASLNPKKKPYAVNPSATPEMFSQFIEDQPLSKSYPDHLVDTPSVESRSEKLERIAEELLNLTKIERYDYSLLFRHKLGFQKYGSALSGAISGAATGKSGSPTFETKVTEKTAFEMKLEKFDAAAKIKIIKEVRTFTDLGLKEANQ
ncbi:hypothetical protein AMTR_s00065p00118020 [Amborella trichopoda]|uniref:Large ribosomal subunit protein bL12 C-terminal domain-containing protein n=1 Tax=Amborella trichopoda TaxID=13333 RepID=U5CZ17_AMBTC|nr:hypothetical protein AMTR_s00065p00118020 [Amborella trichopoda]